jgi:hypothetical protein
VPANLEIAWESALGSSRPAGNAAAPLLSCPAYSAIRRGWKFDCTFSRDGDQDPVVAQSSIDDRSLRPLQQPLVPSTTGASPTESSDSAACASRLRRTPFVGMIDTVCGGRAPLRYLILGLLIGIAGLILGIAIGIIVDRHLF